MKKITLALAALVLLTAATCQCKAEKHAVSQVEKSHGLIAKKFLEYVDKDPALNAATKDDYKKLVESDRRNIEALKRSLGD
jgi:hypothetical protein